MTTYLITYDLNKPGDLSPELPPDLGRVRHLKETDDETIKVHGRADHRDPARAGGRYPDGGCVPQARDQRSDLLQVEVEVWRP